MVALALCVCLALWVAAGYGYWRFQGKLQSKMLLQPRSVRAAAGMGLLFASGLLLFGGFWLLASSGRPVSDLGWIEWLAIVLIGILFVLGQAAAVSCMLCQMERPVTKSHPPASISQNREGKDS